MADFKKVIEQTFIFEGGYQNYPNDSANYLSNGVLIGTNRGISAMAYEDYNKQRNKGLPTVSDMKNLTKSKAEEIYKINFWDKINGDEIKSQPLAHIIFDTHIASGNAGVIRVKKYINDSLKPNSVKVNSKPFSKEELKVINEAKPEKLFEKIKEGEIQFRKYLANQNPSKYGMFLQGWLNRLDKIVFYEDSNFRVSGTGVTKAIGGLILVGVLFASYLLTKKYLLKK